MFYPTFNVELFIQKKYKKGEIIKNEGDVCSSIGIILSGTISITNITYDNKEFLINILHEEVMFGENLIFLNNNRYPGTIICDQNCTIIFINKKHFIYLLQSDINFTNYYLNYISNSFSKIQNRLKILSQRTIKEKFLFFLKSESQRTNKPFVIIKSQTKLAQYLNIPRPSLTRTINQLEKEKIINKKKKIYEIKKA